MRAITYKALLSILIFVSFVGPSCAQPDACIPDDALWADLLKRYVNEAGEVDYRGFLADSTRLNTYLSSLTGCPPPTTATHAEQLAFWINAYNAFTIKLIVQHYPLASIRNIRKVGSVWDMKFFRIGDETMSLNQIEHQILRKRFREPRIHFAIVCASYSCPILRNEPYTALKLEQQLEEQAIRFINDATKNRITTDRLQLSSIFKWFEKDFMETGTLVGFIRKFSSTDLSEKPKVSYLVYDWSLNEWKRNTQ